MSLHLPLRPLGRQAIPRLSRPQCPCNIILSTTTPYIPQRSIFGFFKRRKREQPLDDSSIAELARTRPSQREQPVMAHGGLDSSSIFNEPGEAESAVDTSTPEGRAAQRAAQRRAFNAAVLDPRPDLRLRWQRKKTIQQVQHRGRITPVVALARTERSHLERSRYFATSVKKLMPLARQIAGKTVDEALLQMRFSQKRVARDVHRFLRVTRDKAVLERGMGLQDPVSDEASGDNLEDLSPIKSETIEYQDEKGRRRTVNPNTIYIAQAWVGRGTFVLSRERRARGKINLIRSPMTSLSLLLKEERTRIRETRDRVAKLARKKVWVQHPDRPISTQRQYLMW